MDKPSLQDIIHIVQRQLHAPPPFAWCLSCRAVHDLLLSTLIRRFTEPRRYLYARRYHSSHGGEKLSAG